MTHFFVIPHAPFLVHSGLDAFSETSSNRYNSEVLLQKLFKKEVNSSDTNESLP